MESIPEEVREMIMEYLSNADLFKISLVNKQFNCQARSLMRGRVTSIKTLKPRQLCQQLTSFASHLKTINVVPFSGIHYPLNLESHRRACQPLTPEELDSNLSVILEGFSWKHLSVTFAGDANIIKTCPAAILVTKILQDYSGVLEQLSLNDNFKLMEFLLEVTHDSRFPRLKIIKLDGCNEYDFDGIQRKFLKQMVARAPNLQELHQQKPPDFPENPLQGSSAALVIDCPGFNPIYSGVSMVSTGIVKLKQAKLSFFLDNDIFEIIALDLFSVERFSGNVPGVLQASSYTLNTLDMDLLFLVPLMSYEISFKNLTNFSVALDCARLEFMDPRIFPLLKHFDFTRTAPKVHKVVIYFASSKSPVPRDQIAEFVEQGIAATAMKEPLNDRAVNIKHILCNECLKANAVPFLADWLPDIEKLSVRAHGFYRGALYSQIWKHWLALKQVQVETLCSSKLARTWSVNLDSVLCGIFPQEVAQLRQEDDEYLRAVHIVPVMPAVTCLRALRTIRLILKARSPKEAVQNIAPCPIFSKITGLTAFRRSPHRSVTIETNSTGILKELDHLEPYATMKLQDIVLEQTALGE